MSKETKSNGLFGTELNGFKKKQVNEYIAYLENKHNDASWEQLRKTKEVQEELDSVKAQYAELLDKYNALQAEKAEVANVLITAEKRAAEIIEDAKREGEAEKERLFLEADELRKAIKDRSALLGEMKNESNGFFDTLLDDVKSAVASFEEYIAQGRTQFSEDVEILKDKVLPTVNGEDVLSNEFDVEDLGEADGEACAEAEDAAEAETEEETSAEFVFAEMQARDDGVENTDFDKNFVEMRLDDDEMDI